jgi:AraC-like DNA-binding protein
MVDPSSSTDAFDPLSPVFATLRLEGVLLATVELVGPWGFSVDGFDDVAFYFAARGSCILQCGRRQRSLAAGDLIIVAPRTRHALRDHARSPLVPLTSLQPSQHPPAAPPRLGRPGAPTKLLLGCFRFNPARRALLLSCLPKVIHLSSATANASSRHVMHALSAELGCDEAGSNALRVRLAEALFIQALRSCVQGSSDASGWLRALGDPQLATALTAFHLAPQQPWSVAALARAAGMSRSAFAARFTTGVGQPPLAYVKAWRMALAATLLEDGSLPLKRIATLVGYGSDEAFNRAFGQVMATTPGAYRARLRSAAERQG